MTMAEKAAGTEAAGKIVAFYSFKGGVGRSLVLANVAWTLAACGKRVLVIDWDLEAPGLHEYFRSCLDGLAVAGGVEGVIDLLVRLGPDPRPKPDAEPDPKDSQRASSPPPVPAELDRDPQDIADAALAGVRPDEFVIPLGMWAGCPGLIDLMPAGIQDERYSERVAAFRWDEFYDRRGGERYLHGLAALLRSEYHHVLIDCRTGIGETAMAGPLQLADTVVNCFGMSRQSIDGAVRMLKHIDKRRRRGESAPKRVLPLPMRVDRGRSAPAYAARQIYERKFTGSLIRLGIDASTYWPSVEIPYQTDYAYEELLAPSSGLDPRDDRIAPQVNALVRYATGEELDGIPEIPAAERARLHRRARREREATFGRMVLSFAQEDAVWAAWIEWCARSRGFEVIRHSVSAPIWEDLPPAEFLANHSGGAGAEPICVVPVLSTAYQESTAGEGVLAWARDRLTSSKDRVLRPVRVQAGAVPARGALDLFGLDTEVAAGRLADLLGPVAGGREPRRHPEPPFPGGMLPIQERYRQRLARAHEAANGRAVALNAIRLGVSLLEDGRTFEAEEQFDAARRRADLLGESGRALSAAAYWRLGRLALDGDDNDRARAVEFFRHALARREPPGTSPEAGPETGSEATPEGGADAGPETGAEPAAGEPALPAAALEAEDEEWVPAAADIRLDLARAYRLLSQEPDWLAEAEGLVEAVLAGSGPGDARTEGRARVEASMIEISRGRTAYGRRGLLRARFALTGRDPATVCAIDREVARLAEADGDLTAAGRYYEIALANADLTAGETGWRFVVELNSDAARLFDRQGNPNQARLLYERALEATGRDGTRDYQLYFTTAIRLARVTARIEETLAAGAAGPAAPGGQPRTSRDCYREAVDAAVAHNLPPHADLADALRQIRGWVHETDGAQAAALNVARTCWIGLRLDDEPVLTAELEWLRQFREEIDMPALLERVRSDFPQEDAGRIVSLLENGKASR